MIVLAAVLWIWCDSTCCSGMDIEDITRLQEDMDFMFEWQEQYV